MNIGFDAKRAFFNMSGLGNYSRNIISALSQYASVHQYHLFTPKTKGSVFNLSAPNIKVFEPSGFAMKYFKPYWRTFGLANDLRQRKIDVYHGLSNELPFNIHKSGIKSVVTIHDLIFLRYPKLYRKTDRAIYNQKFRYACKVADKIISISTQTKYDLMDYYSIPARQIDVIYQGCNPVYQEEVPAEKKMEVIQKYRLPENFILTVGNIEERKNVLQVLRALQKEKIDIPYVIVGKSSAYADKLKQFVAKKKISHVYFLHDVPDEYLPAIYQLATAFIYPSIFEGFGIPILEALWSGIPVITSKGGCFEETGGPYTKYINPEDADEIGDAIKEVLYNTEIQRKMIEGGLEHAKKFSEKHIAETLINIYQSLLK